MIWFIITYLIRIVKIKYLAVFFILMWWFVGWPPIWQDPRIPPKTQTIEAASPETFTTSGTFTVPNGIYSVDVGCWGGGGGGGGSAKSKTSNAGGGGGGGAYAKTTGIGVTSSGGYAVVVGSGGSGGDVAAGSPGTNSSFATNLVIAVGGGAGGLGGASVGTSGIGGAAGSCTGDAGKKFSGGNGATGLVAGAGGGGGGSAGDNGNGGFASGQTAGIGGTFNGGGGGNGGASSAVGNPGNSPGGAGGGGGKGGSSAGRVGGDGTDGQCIVTYTDTWAPSTSQTLYLPTWSFATNPFNTSATGIGMTATTGYDYTGPIKYLFTLDNTGCSIGYSGAGGTTSSWQTSISYNDTGLDPNKCYGYKVTASDSVGTTHVGTASGVITTYTSANTPGTPILSNPTLTTLNLTNDANGNPASNPTTNFAVQVVTTSPSDSTWLSKWVNASGDPGASEVWMNDAALDALVIRGLKPGTLYGVKVKAKNQDNDETLLGPEGQNSTTAPIISVSVSDGIVTYGVLGVGGTKTTIDLSNTQIAKNEGDVAEDFTIKTSNAIGGVGWTLAAVPGTDEFVHEFSINAGVGWTQFTAADSYQPFVSNVGVSSNQSFDLRIIAPTSASDGVLKTISVTILATQH